MQDFVKDTLRKEYRLQDLRVNGRVLLKWIVNKWRRGGRAWTGLMWLTVGTSCGDP
jgi:hypothetical protein